MIAGTLKYLLELLKPNTQRNDFGEKFVTYEPTVTVHAERVKLSGTRSLVVSETFANYDAVYNIRNVHKVAEGWRIQEKGGNLYNVANIIPNPERGMKTLLCSRVNE
jgi:SPP1 family predicted phage head-tail adaptor